MCCIYKQTEGAFSFGVFFLMGLLPVLLLFYYWIEEVLVLGLFSEEPIQN